MRLKLQAFLAAAVVIVVLFSLNNEQVALNKLSGQITSLDMRRATTLSTPPIFEHVLLMGQFSQETESSLILHWVNRWSEIFKNVVVWGPFANATVDKLHQHDVAVFSSENDGLENLGNTLALYEHRTKGVLFAHSDAYINITQLGDVFDKEQEVLVQSNPRLFKRRPAVYVYSNATFSHRGRLFPIQDYRKAGLSFWWGDCIKGISRAALSDSERNEQSLLLENGSIGVPGTFLGAFVYIPAGLANDMAIPATMLSESNVSLDCGLPVLLATIPKRHAAIVKALDYSSCKDRKVDKIWTNLCSRDGQSVINSTRNHGDFPPMDINEGTTRWDQSFDVLVRGQKVAPNQARLKQLRVHDVVLLGQFNYNLDPKLVTHWARRWSDIFKSVAVIGPFDNEAMNTLKQSGVNVFQGKNDSGYYSPMQNLGRILRLYANDKRIRGVMYAHDDMMINITRLFELGFPLDNEILGQAPPEVFETPLIRVYDNNTYATADGRFFSDLSEVTRLRPWGWWPECIPGLFRAAATDPRSKQYMDVTGGLPVFANGVGDFAYVPISLAEPFAAIADWLADNHVFLECGMPTIFGMLRERYNATVRFVDYCTDFSKHRGDPSLWASSCIKGGNSSIWYYPSKQRPALPYGLYHPIKLGMGIDAWNNMFDAVLGL